MRVLSVPHTHRFSASGTSISTRSRGNCGGNGRRPVGRVDPTMLFPRPLAGVHFRRLVARLQLFGELREGEAQHRTARRRSRERGSRVEPSVRVL